MRRIHFLTHCAILASSPVLLAYPQNHLSYVSSQRVHQIPYEEQWVRPKTYDAIIQMLHDLESGELEKRYSVIQLSRINEFLVTLARQGILPKEGKGSIIEKDACDLLYGKNSAFQVAYSLQNKGRVVPAVLQGYAGYDAIQCGFFGDLWKDTKEFVKEHKKEIIIGVVVVVAVGVIVGVAAASAGAAGTAGTAAASSKSESSSSSPPRKYQAEAPSNDMPVFQDSIEKEIDVFKDNITQEGFFQPPGEGLSLEETGKTLGSVFGHNSLNHMQNDLSNNPYLFQEMQEVALEYDLSLPPEAVDSPTDFGHLEMDKSFSSDCGSLFADPFKERDLTTMSYQAMGEKALDFGYHNQALYDLSQAIDRDPADPNLYLYRSSAYFAVGNYEQSFEDFQAYYSQKQNQLESVPFSPKEFTMGFAKGVPQGVYDSGRGTLLFIGNLITDPVHTSSEVYQAFSTLAELAKDEEWGKIAESLSPEAHKLVSEWDSLSSEERGELAGYVLGKHGTDILAPGAVAKFASKSAKGAQEMGAFLKNIERAEEALVLETAAKTGNAAKVGEIISKGKANVFLGEELGFSAKEMGQLQKAGKLEQTLEKEFSHLSLPKQESLKLFSKAEKFLASYKGFKPECEIRNLIHQTGVPTFSRPKGVPDNYRVKLSNNGAGMIYMHPEHNHTSIRVMPGKPHSPWPYQQKPYVIQTKNGKILGRSGNIVSKNAPEAHIPVEEFVFIGD